MKCLGMTLPDVTSEWCKQRYDASRFTDGCAALLISQPPQNDIAAGESNCTALTPELSLKGSGYFIYPPDGYMGWHTNSDRPRASRYPSHALRRSHRFGDSSIEVELAVWFGILSRQQCQAPHGNWLGDVAGNTH